MRLYNIEIHEFRWKIIEFYRNFSNLNFLRILHEVRFSIDMFEIFQILYENYEFQMEFDVNLNCIF